MMYACHLVNRLLLYAIGGKTPIEVWLEETAQDYDSLRIFWMSCLLPRQEIEVGSESREMCIFGLQMRC